MSGRQVSVYVTDEEDEIIVQRVRDTGYSYSQAKRDLVYRGNNSLMREQLMRELAEMRNE